MKPSWVFGSEVLVDILEDAVVDLALAIGNVNIHSTRWQSRLLTPTEFIVDLCSMFSCFKSFRVVKVGAIHKHGALSNRTAREKHTLFC